MKKRILAFLIVIAIIFAFTGCQKADNVALSSNVEVIVEEETVVQGGNDMTSNNETANGVVSNQQTTQQSSQVANAQSSQVTNSSQQSNQQTNQQSNSQSGQQANSSVNQQSSQQSESSSIISSSQDTSTDTNQDNGMVNIDYEWKSHSEDFKLIAFTFDDGPSSKMQDYVTLFSAFEGAGTFFVNGYKIDNDYKYTLMQNAINYGWDIGNHGDNHLVATIGGTGGSETTYDQLKSDILNLTNKLQSNLKKRDGSAYEVSIYRAPNIKPTANTFKICSELNYPVIWLADDALDWDETKTDNDRENVFKNGLKNWKDGDVILCHEMQQFADQTYKNLEVYLPLLYRAGYRFCSVTELMQLRGVSRSEISGELNNVDGNRGMVRNIVTAAQHGKK